MGLLMEDILAIIYTKVLAIQSTTRRVKTILNVRHYFIFLECRTLYSQIHRVKDDVRH
jgi:hypothetical protein